MANLYQTNGGYVTKSAKPALSRTRIVPVDSEFLLTGEGTNNAANSTAIIDGSSSPKTVTAFGTNTVQLGFSPFGTSGPGGLRIAGTSGQYVGIGTNTDLFPVANEDFTWECWIYITATPGVQGAQIFGRGEYGLNHDYNFFIDPSRRFGSYWGVPGVNVVQSATALVLNTWYHLAFVRQGTGTNNCKFYLDGVLNAQGTTNATTIASGSGNLTIGADSAGDESILAAILSSMRLVKGTAVYTADFIRPNSKLTAITNTTLLLNFDNFAIADRSGKNLLPCYATGNARIFNNTAKFGSTSLTFSGGSNSAIQVGTAAGAAAFNVGSGVFTVEAWVWINNYSFMSGQGSIIIGASEFGGTNNWWFGLTTAGFLTITIGATTTAASTAVGLNTWKHVAAVRSGTTVTLYVDGTSVASGTNSASLTSANNIVWVGGDASGDEQLFQGNMDDIRFMKTAVYTANFTPPTARLSNAPGFSSTVSTSTYGVFRLS